MRRSVIGLILLVLGILSVPFSSDTQHPGKVYRIGFLSAFSPPLPSAPSPFLDAFWHQLRELGWMQGDRTILTRLPFLTYNVCSAAPTKTPHERRRAQRRAPGPGGVYTPTRWGGCQAVQRGDTSSHACLQPCHSGTRQ
jgi:hypothetical protein